MRARAAEFAPAGRNRWHSYLDAYQVMPTELLLCAEEVALQLDLAALISRPGARMRCAVCAEEVINERAVVRAGRVLCRSCAGAAYYALPGQQPPLLALSAAPAVLDSAEFSISR